MVQKFNLWTAIGNSNTILNRKFQIQLLVTIAVNIITFSHGVGVGWLSPTLVKLQSNDSPLDFDINIEEASWMGSLIGPGGLLGNLIFGAIIDKVGRKICIYMIAVPHIFLWIFIYFAKSVEYLYVARFLGGFTGGSAYVVLPIFISEIADPSIRGTLASMLMLSLNFGVLLGFILSTHLAYHLIPFIVIFLPLVYLVTAIFFPETPQHLLRKSNYIAAEKSFNFYKHYGKRDETNVECQKQLNEFNDLKTIVINKKSDTKLTFKDFITKSALKSFCTAAVLLIATQGSGSFAFINYMTHIFAASGTNLSPNTSTIIMGVVQIFGVYAAILFVDRCGRKVLLLISTGGMSIGLTIFGLFTYFKPIDNDWIPVAVMGFVIFIANIGVVTMTFVMLVELMPLKIRSIATSFCMAVLSVLVFIALKAFPVLMNIWGISIVMWSCAAVSFVCLIYLSILLPETKGKPMDAE
ncbi:facilitated trehalose transporter Tret1 [Teleopsis dalmanni]|uniref:facilitated trehalose transporter Tret1 n=1 Tax=Teleopsis dalmanni TaxID=139649 RepID=UPI0018CCB1EE|nr:facilitated trehalose transporter Tret1 [Teleopsis dalmanni]XP_037927515.1 facilitated trehalose transporter Tret1 [Teleopsis dalmanni]